MLLILKLGFCFFVSFLKTFRILKHRLNIIEKELIPMHPGNSSLESARGKTVFSCIRSWGWIRWIIHASSLLRIYELWFLLHELCGINSSKSCNWFEQRNRRLNHGWENGLRAINKNLNMKGKSMILLFILQGLILQVDDFLTKNLLTNWFIWWVNEKFSVD